MFFDFTDATEVGEYFFLGFLANRAGIEQYHVGLIDVVGFAKAALFAQYVVDFIGIIFVHLTAEGFDINFFHVFFPSRQWFNLGTLVCNDLI